MSNYFSYFPTVEHDLTQDGETVTVTNILKRFAFVTNNLDQVDVFHDYRLQDGDRPDIIAAKYYEDSKYAWVVLLFNNIIDPFYEWPLYGQDFTNYLIAKYGTVAKAHTTTKKYFKIIYEGFTTPTSTFGTTPTGNVRVPTKKLEIDLRTYNSLGANDKSVQTAYEYELELNDDRRVIRILDKKYLGDVLDEAVNILGNST